MRIPFEALSEARLVLTDDLIRDALSKDNQAKKQARKRDRPNPGESGQDEQDGGDAGQENT